MKLIRKHGQLLSAHCVTWGYIRRLERAKDIVKKALDVPVKWHVAFSGGKDSSVALHLTGVPAIWSDEEFYVPETGEYMDRISTRHELHQIRITDRHADCFNVVGEYGSLMEYPRKAGFGGVFYGLRKQENSRRRVHLNTFGELFHSKKDGFWHCSPLANWSWLDVWTYIWQADMDYNEAYDVMVRNGIDLKTARIGPFATEIAVGYGQLAIIKKCWPSEYNRFAKRHKLASCYV